MTFGDAHECQQTKQLSSPTKILNLQIPLHALRQSIFLLEQHTQKATRKQQQHDLGKESNAASICAEQQSAGCNESPRGRAAECAKRDEEGRRQLHERQRQPRPAARCQEVRRVSGLHRLCCNLPQHTAVPALCVCACLRALLCFVSGWFLGGLQRNTNFVCLGCNVV